MRFSDDDVATDWPPCHVLCQFTIGTIQYYFLGRRHQPGNALKIVEKVFSSALYSLIQSCDFWQGEVVDDDSFYDILIKYKRKTTTL